LIYVLRAAILQKYPSFSFTVVNGW
jgi:hypothetical protein